jgi:hypothetical protein
LNNGTAHGRKGGADSEDVSPGMIPARDHNMWEEG